MSSSSQNRNNVQEVGTPPRVKQFLRTSLTAVSTAVRNKVTKTVSEKRLLRTSSAARQSSQPCQWPREQHSYACMVMNS